MIKSDSPVSIRHQLVALLMKEIDEQRFIPGQRFPSERELAIKYGISRTSVREAVTQMITQGVLARSNGRGTFVADRSGTIVPGSSSSRALGFWISEQVFHFVQAGYNQILSGVMDICRSAGCELKFQPVREGIAAADIAKDPSFETLDGSIVVGGINRSLLQLLESRGAPVMLVDLLNSKNAGAVSIDYATGTHMAIDALYNLGHREIGFIGFPHSRKYISYWESLQTHGLPYNPHFVQFLNVQDLMPGMLAGYQAMQSLIEGAARPTAVLITNDCAAQGGMDALAIAKIDVPEQMSIIGYDDLGQLSTPLTTIRADLVEVGRIAAQSLLRWVETGVRPEQEITVPVELIPRATTAAPPGDRTGR